MITFERRVLPDDHNHTETWVFGFKQWAEVQRTSETVARFIIPHTTGLRSDTYRIVWDGQLWPITSVVKNHFNNETVIDCDFSMMEEGTHLQSTEREYAVQTPLVRPKTT